MAYPGHVWAQLRNLTARDLSGALHRDGWVRDTKGGSQYVYRKAGDPPRRVSIHMHPGKTYGAKMLQAVLEDIGWSIEDLRRVKLIR